VSLRPLQSLPDHPEPASQEQIAASLAPWLSLATYPAAGSPIRLGVSGGADSLALLALAVASGCDATAVHVDHGQRPGSADEAEFVSDAARAIGANFEGHTLDVPAGSNLEARLRAARYAVLGKDAATGHTADDQAETVLINLLRGAGIVGLGAMTPGFRRPILGLRRSDTEDICAHLGWTPFSDPSNTDPAHLRNRVRHELVALMSDLADRDVVPLLVRTAGHARSAATVLERLADEVDPTDARALSRTHQAVAAIAIQRWIRASSETNHPIDAAAVARVLAVAAGDAVAAEVVGGLRVARSEQRLRIEPTGTS